MRGIWQQPALTIEDIGKPITVVGNSVKIGRETRMVQWQDAAPEGITEVRILDVSFPNDFDDEGTQSVLLEGEPPRRLAMPYMQGVQKEVVVQKEPPARARAARSVRRSCGRQPK